jgi:2-polyprenyl-3-methyl-5-hydroxy-6-metoxy-1,4-benzoquinol methylase
MIPLMSATNVENQDGFRVLAWCASGSRPYSRHAVIESEMTDPFEINRRNWDERVTIHARDATGDYMLDRFRAGEDALHDIEAAELGDITGKRVLHLQCHIGRDTLCLARRGAIVTGLDFSAPALEVAKKLAAEAKLEATFVQGTVDDAPQLAPGPFDMVFTTWGTICWLPDMARWARVIAAVLKPGGELYFADQHPSFAVLEVVDGKLAPSWDFQTTAGHPLEFVSATTYTGDQTVMTNQATREWIHSLSSVLGGLIAAGMSITMFHEHEVLPWQSLSVLVPATDRMWRLPEGFPRMPLSYSLRARKLGAA